MSTLTTFSPTPAAHESPRQDAHDAAAQRLEEFGRIILAYSEVTEKLELSHARLEKRVESLRAELGEKNRLLERKNRLAALGEMAAGMAHEIRNPLGAIQLYASLLSKDVAGQPASLELVRKITGGVKRLESLVSSVLHFSREIHLHLVETDLAERVEQAVELARPRLDSDGIACHVHGPRPFPVRVDADLMEQTILNLVLNAAEAIGEANEQKPNTITVRFARPMPDEADKGLAKQFSLEVCDSGPGIPPEILDRIFNPFFTTKHAGTGLGLAIVHRVIDAHDGTILAANAPGGGARFEIRI